MRVSVIGAGAVGGPLISALRAGTIAGAELGDVVTRDGGEPRERLDRVLAASDLVVEAAGQEAAAQYGPAVVGAGRHLLLVSIGALADDGLARQLAAGPGRLYLCAGAVGGIDLLRAAMAAGGLREVRLTTTKNPGSLPADGPAAQPDDEPKQVFSGTAREAARLFPQNLNVAAAVALASVGLDRTVVTLVNDPRARRTSHVVEASGEAGDYRFEITNQPVAERPATSAIVPGAVIRAVATIAGANRCQFV